MNVIVPQGRLEAARRRRELRDEQAFIDACEAALDEQPRDMGDLIDKAKARVDAQRQNEAQR